MSTLAPEPVHCTPRGDNGALLTSDALRDRNPAEWAWLTERFAQDVADLPRHLSATPPQWVTFADTEGNFDGPGATHDKISVSSAWSADGGPVMWIDALLHESADVDPESAVALAVDILRVATTVRPELLAGALAQVIETLAPAGVTAPSAGAATNFPAPEPGTEGPSGAGICNGYKPASRIEVAR